MSPVRDSVGPNMLVLHSFGKQRCKVQKGPGFGDTVHKLALIFICYSNVHYFFKVRNDTYFFIFKIYFTYAVFLTCVQVLVRAGRVVLVVVVLDHPAAVLQPSSLLACPVARACLSPPCPPSRPHLTGSKLPPGPNQRRD